MPPKKILVNHDANLPLEAKVASKSDTKQRVSVWTATPGAKSVGATPLSFSAGNEVSAEDRTADGKRVFKNTARLPFYGNSYKIEVKKKNATSRIGAKKTAEVDAGDVRATTLEVEGWRKIYIGLTVMPHVKPWIAGTIEKLNELFRDAFIEFEAEIVDLAEDHPIIESHLVEKLAIDVQPKPTTAPKLNRWIRIVCVDVMLSKQLSYNKRTGSFRRADGVRLLNANGEYFIVSELPADDFIFADRFGADPVPARYTSPGQMEKENPVKLTVTWKATAEAADIARGAVEEKARTVVVKSAAVNALLDRSIRDGLGGKLSVRTGVEGSPIQHAMIDAAFWTRGADGSWSVRITEADHSFPYKELVKDKPLAKLELELIKAFELKGPDGFRVQVDENPLRDPEVQAAYDSNGGKLSEADETRLKGKRMDTAGRRRLVIEITDRAAVAVLNDVLWTNPDTATVAYEFTDVSGSLVAGESADANIVCAIGATRQSMVRTIGEDQAVAHIAATTARLFAHEINHAIGGVVPYADPVPVPPGAAGAAPATATKHGFMYPETEGGGATLPKGHCRFNNVKKPQADLKPDKFLKSWVEASKPSVWIPEPGKKPCIMHHKIDTRQEHEMVFCADCIKQMRALDLSPTALTKWAAVK